MSQESLRGRERLRDAVFQGFDLQASLLAGEVGPLGWALFGTVFAWQFPHFMAIAWMYREDYARAGHRMVTSEPNSEGMAGRYALLYSLSIVPVTLMPALSGMAGMVYVVGALLLGAFYIVPSVRFAREENLANARKLLLASIIYLPALMALLFIDPVLRGQ